MPNLGQPSASRTPALILCTLVFVLPLAYWTEMRDYTLPPRLLLLQVALIALLLGWVATGIQTIRLSPLGLPALVYLLLSALSLLHALDSVAGLLELVKLLGGFTLFFLVINRLNSKHIPLVLCAWILAGLSIALLGISQHLGWQPFPIPSAGLPSATLGYRNIAAMYLIQSIPFGVVLAGIAPSRRWTTIASISTSLMLAFLFYTRTRGAWLGLVVAVLFTTLALVLNRAKNRFPDLRFKKIILGLALVTTVLLTLLPTGLAKFGPQSIDEKKEDAGTAVASIFRPGGDRGRLLLWRNTLDLVAHHPVLGVGLGNWSVHYPYYDHGDRIRFDTAPERPHNDLLGILSETGLPGFLAYLWLGVTAFSVGWTLLRSPSLETRCIAAACLAGLLAISVHSLFSFPRERMAPTVFFWLTLGLLGTLHPASNSRFARGVAAKTVGLFLLLLLLLQAGIGIRFAQFETRMHRATAAQRRGDLLNTVHETGTAIRAGRFHPEVLHLRGFALNQTGQFTSAYELYTQALEARPYDIQLLNGMAIACQNLEKTGAAIAAYTRALELVPNLPDVWYNLALLYMQTGQTESALQACLKAVDLSPNDAQFYVALGELYARSGRVPEALDAYRAFLRHWTGDPRHAETVRTRIANLSTRIAE